MDIIPAIDIMGGKVVRLLRGEAKHQTVYSDSPQGIALRWASYGVRLIHVVDLDGAFGGELKNFDVVREIAKSVKPKIELGGGIRDVKTVEMVLGSGVEKVCIGTKALDRRFLEKIGKDLKDRIVVSIDAKSGIVYSKGWIHKTERSAVSLAKEAESLGIKTINYTDISRDGTMEGPNIDSLKELLSQTNIDIVTSGGISSLDDIKRLKALGNGRLTGVIVGKALYEGQVDLAEAMKVCAC